MNQSLIFLYQGNKIYFQLYHTVLQTMYPYIYIYIYIYIYNYIFIYANTNTFTKTFLICLHPRTSVRCCDLWKERRGECVCVWMNEARVYFWKLFDERFSSPITGYASPLECIVRTWLTRKRIRANVVLQSRSIEWRQTAGLYNVIPFFFSKRLKRDASFRCGN